MLKELAYPTYILLHMLRAAAWSVGDSIALFDYQQAVEVMEPDGSILCQRNQLGAGAW